MMMWRMRRRKRKRRTEAHPAPRPTVPSKGSARTAGPFARWKAVAPARAAARGRLGGSGRGTTTPNESPVLRASRQPPAARPRPRGWVAITALLTVAACATAGRPADPADRAPSRTDIDAAVAALERAEAECDAGRYESAAAMADSLFEAWRRESSLGSLADRALLLQGRAREAAGLPGRAGEAYDAVLGRVSEGPLRNEAIDRYTRILARTGREGEAVELALANPGVLDELGLEDLRQWAAGLSITQLRAAGAAHEPASREAQIVHVQLAQLLAAAGETAEARRVAAGVLEGRPAEPERSTAELLAAAEGALDDVTARIGAILPLSGELAGVGELLREGIELALDEYRSEHPDGPRVELVVEDDASDPERAAALVAELERGGAVAILGPLRSESFAAAAHARTNRRLPIVSPTATEVLGSMEHAYSLYDLGRRERDVARDLAEWSVAELGLRRGALLIPADPAGSRAAEAFRTAYEEAGGQIVAEARYDPDSTTFQLPITTVAAANPDIVFAPVDAPQTVLTLAPQLVYYGLDRSIVLGGEGWTDPTVLRRLEPFAANYRVVGLWVDRVSAGTPWQSFVNSYERTYRKSLRDNMLPALAYDAATLVLDALASSGLPIPAALAARLEGGARVEGVTGVLAPDPATSTVRRDTRIRMLLDGALVTADRSELLNWLAEARARPRDPDGGRRR